MVITPLAVRTDTPTARTVQRFLSTSQNYLGLGTSIIRVDEKYRGEFVDPPEFRSDIKSDIWGVKA